MLGKLAALDPPDVDRAELDLLPGRRNAEEWTLLSTRLGASRDNFVGAKDTILDDQMEIGESRIEARALSICAARPGGFRPDRCRYVSVKISAKELVSCAFTAAV